MKKKPLVIPEDLKRWYAISCPTTGVRFDRRMLELMDADHDGHIRTGEVLAAVKFLEAKGVTVEALTEPKTEDEKRLEDVKSRLAALDQQKPSDLEKAAMEAWVAAGRDKTIAVCGDEAKTAEGSSALAAVEAAIDEYFTPPADMPLVTDEPDRELPLADHLNPKHLESILAFAEKCVRPLLGERKSLTRLEWKRVKGAFAPYRAWVASKPVMSAAAKAELEDEERLLRYKLHLGEFLENYVTMDRLYRGEDYAIFQTGVLRIDGRELNLCFHVESEAAHSALAEKSKCCLAYLKLTSPTTGETRNLCAAVTAGTVAGLYVGRNAVFYDRDGSIWGAVVTKFVESPVSLWEAFWMPWRKLGEGVSAAVKKFLGDRQSQSMAKVQKGTESAQAGGAAMASSVAAIGIGIGMVGAAMASVLAAVKNMRPHEFALALVALVLIVSLPSMILAWFKLRQRDLGAILNACGWAVNRKMRFSMWRARRFTRCVRGII